MNKYKFKLSPKMIDFLKSSNDVDVLEGTTSAGKTTIAIPKFMFEVAKSFLYSEWPQLDQSIPIELLVEFVTNYKAACEHGY